MLKSVNLKNSANSIDSLFQYLRVGTLNDLMLNVLQAENRTLAFHIHEQSDEMFYCIEGEFDIETEDGLTHLKEGDFVIIPKGTKHRLVVTSLVKCLLIETEGTLNKDYRRSILTFFNLLGRKPLFVTKNDNGMG